MTQALHDLIDGLEVLICGLDEAGTIHMFNRPCERITGLTRDEAVGRSWLEIFAIGQRPDHVMTLWSQARGDAPAGPYEALCRQGRSLRWQFSRWDGQRMPLVTLWAVGVDVTDERAALVRAREHERVLTLGNLVAGLTHQIRNPLNGALLQLALADRNLVRRDDPTLGPAAYAIARAIGEMRRISTLLDDFLVFVRPQPLQLERVDARRVVARAIERASGNAQTAEAAVALEPGDDVIAQLDGPRVESAVYHLLANAIDAVSGGNERAVCIRVFGRGNTIAIEVEDRGPGLPSKDTPAFEPFFTTKEGGSGLGLAIVARVATDHGGTITYERRDGATVFRLELPIVGGGAN
jgi:PAS domain S-box-containing protein